MKAGSKRNGMLDRVHREAKTVYTTGFRLRGTRLGKSRKGLAGTQFESEMDVWLL